MSEFIELQLADGAVWVRADKIVAVLAHKFRYMDGSGYREANGSMLLLQLTPSELIAFERPSEVLAKIAEATSASQS